MLQFAHPLGESSRMACSSSAYERHTYGSPNVSREGSPSSCSSRASHITACPVPISDSRPFPGAVQQLREHRCSEVKNVVKDIVERMLPMLLDEAGEGSGVSSGGGGGGGAGSGGGGVGPLAERLQVLTPVGFIKILLVISRWVGLPRGGV